MEGSAVSVDGVPVSFEVRGTGAPTLVLVHGWSCDRGYWKHQLEAFADRYQVVAVDLAGHGKSGIGRHEWTMPAFGEDVVAVADQLALGQMVLIGHSMGGDVIVEAARRLPGRVVGLVWVDTYRTLGDSLSRGEVESFLAPFRADFASAARDFVLRMFLPTSDGDLVQWVADDMAAAPPEIAVDAMEHAITFQPAVVDALREMRIPVVALNPDDKPSDVEALQRHGVRTVPISGVGHFPMMEDPSAFNLLLERTLRELMASRVSAGGR